MTWYDLEGRTIQTWPSYLLVGWQCDIQIAYGSLWKAFTGFWLSQEGEAATWLLAHISDLWKMETTASRVDSNKQSRTTLQRENVKIFFLYTFLYFVLPKPIARSYKRKLSWYRWENLVRIITFTWFYSMTLCHFNSPGLWIMHQILQKKIAMNVS